MTFFNPATCGFIPEHWKSDGTYSKETWPADAVLLTAEEQSRFWKQSPPDGKTLGSLAGRPAWVELAASVTVDELSAHERAWRDGQVSTTEWLVTRHRDEQDMQLATTLTAKQFAELLQYRQALRDWPQSELFPGSEHRPVPAPWLESMPL